MKPHKPAGLKDLHFSLVLRVRVQGTFSSHSFTGSKRSFKSFTECHENRFMTPSFFSLSLGADLLNIYGAIRIPSFELQILLHREVFVEEDIMASEISESSTDQNFWTGMKLVC